MALLTESQLVVLFAGLLAASSVVLLFVPVLRHTWLFAATPIGFALIVGPMLALSVGAIALVALAVSDPVYFIPVVAATMALRVASPPFVYRRLREWFEEKRGWAELRLLVLAGFLAFAGVLAYELVVAAAGPRAPGPVALSEQLIMAFGASGAMVRFALRARPKGRGAPWTLWFAAILFAAAFVIVAPYAFPEFAVLYAGSGLVGWAIGAIALWYDR